MGKLRYPLLIGAGALLLRRQQEDLFALALAMAIWTGLILAVRMAPSIATIRSRLPSLRECLALCTGLATAYLGFGVADDVLLSALLRPSGRGPVSERIAGALLPLWLGIALLPVVAQLLRQSRGAAFSLRHALAGMAAALPLGLALFLTWQMAGKPLALHGLDNDLVPNAITLVPVAGFLLGLGGLFWWPALTGKTQAPPQFQSLMRLARLLWGAQAGLVIIGLTLLFAGTWEGNSGLVLGALSLIAVALAWMQILGRLENFPAASTVRTLMAAAALLICFAASQLPPVWIMASGRTTIGDAGALVAIFLLPLLAGAILLCLRWMPWAMRRIIGSPKSI